MLDIIVPVPFQNLSLMPDCIDSLLRTTDLPFEIHIIIDGGIREDLTAFEHYINSTDCGWRVLHNPQPVGLNRSILEVLDGCRQRLTVLCGPEIRMEDPKWAGKMKQIFDRDHICGIVDTEPNTASATLYPVKRQGNKPAKEGCRFAMLQTRFAVNTPPLGAVDPVAFWSRKAMLGGGSSWAAPGVRYFEVEHLEHDLWRAPSGLLASSESQSRTTRG